MDFEIPGYEALANILEQAYRQASQGKGKERHATSGQPFHAQRMQTSSDAVGSPDGMAYQVIKKMTEGLEFDDRERCERELLGAINYLAGIAIWLRRKHGLPLDGPLQPARPLPTGIQIGGSAREF